jgi:hypothetical protein
MGGWILGNECRVKRRFLRPRHGNPRVGAKLEEIIMNLIFWVAIISFAVWFCGAVRLRVKFPTIPWGNILRNNMEWLTFAAHSWVIWGIFVVIDYLTGP